MNIYNFLCTKCFQFAFIKLNYKLKDTIEIECNNCKFKENLNFGEYLKRNNTIQNLCKEKNQCEEHNNCFLSTAILAINIYVKCVWINIVKNTIFQN